MKVIKGKTIQKVYSKLVKILLKNKNFVGNTKEIENACLIIENPSLDNISFPFRSISKKYSEAELKWYWSADNKCETIGKYAKMWLRLTDDGLTNNSAYGYILFKKYGFNQLEQIIELLKLDKNTRRAVLNISDPAINRITTKDMQCTVAIQFLIRNDKLNMTVYMRSNDVYFGLPYDYIFFESLHQYVAYSLNKLKIKIGTYTHITTSLHMYERDIEKFKKQKENVLSINLKENCLNYYDKLGEND